MFKNLKGKNQKVKPPNRHSSFPEIFQENPESKKETKITSEQESMTRSNVNTIEDLFQEKNADAQIVTLIEQQRTLEQKIKNIHSEKDRITKRQSISIAPNKHTSLSVGEQKIIDGVIWAEILGPPRSRSPHRVLKGK
jgi:hypothetical protein